VGQVNSILLKSDVYSTNHAMGAGQQNFRFPSLDPETEKFLWRRKADLEMSLRQLDSLSGQMSRYSGA
jgi:hypothetical protein